MPQPNPHSILSLTPEVAADWSYFSSVPWIAERLGLSYQRTSSSLSSPLGGGGGGGGESPVTPYTVDLPVNAPGRPGDTVLGGWMAGERALGRHVSLLVSVPPPGSGSEDRLGLTEGLEGPGLEKGSEKGIDTETGTSAEVMEGSPSPPGAGLRKDGGPEVDGGEDRSPYPAHIDLFTLGPALNGIPSTLHGGVLTLLVDACCGRVGYMHRDAGGQAYTKYTNTRFLRPAMADGEGVVTVMVRTRVCAVRGWKGQGEMVIRCVVEGVRSRKGGGGLKSGGDGDAEWERVVYAVGESCVVERMWRGRM
ncbi:hypothetical protein F5Y15DRAFT_219331 [Xylariaceae sp. FL0016]|nr:hypothetical protein F5Y15DRAFT_219331 [Xylariaceae sp. FL0016]